MKRRKYKDLYLSNKADKESLINILNHLIEGLKTFKKLNVIDKIEKPGFTFEEYRTILISSDFDFLNVVINKTLLENIDDIDDEEVE